MSEETAPTKSMIECWQDDKRMNSLFLPFRKKELNPVDWESKMKYWHSAIDSWVFENNNCIIFLKKLEKEFKRKERSPLCLGTVVDHLERAGELLRKEDFMNLSVEESWSQWVVSSIFKKPALWSYSKIKGALIEQNYSEVHFVYLKFLKERGNDILSIVKSKKKYLLSMEDIDFLLRDSGMEIPIETLHYILHWLGLQKKVTMINFEGHQLIKFAERENLTAIISEADAAIFILKHNKAALIKNLESLEVEKQEAIEETKLYLRKGMRHVAKSSLRKKKELEKCIEKRSAALDNAEVLLSRIREAESDAKVIEAYKMGLSALKTTFKNAGLTEDSVISTLDEVHEIIDIHDEIQSSLSQTVEPLLDDELEKELAKLMETQNEEPEISTKENFPDFPEVPNHDLDLLTEKIKKMNSMVQAE